MYLEVNNLLLFTDGRSMDETVNRRLLTAKTRMRSDAHSCGVCDGRGDTGTGLFSPSISVFTCQYHSTSVLYVTYMDCHGCYVILMVILKINVYP
jgi:hypothetical protein